METVQSEGKGLQDIALEERKIFVGGLHADTTNESLKEYFQKYGEVDEATVMYDAVTKRSRGFGFVTFKDPSVIPKACSKNYKHFLDSKEIDPKPAYEKGHEDRVQKEMHLNKVFVGGLPQTASTEDVEQYFSKYGKVINVDLKVDKATHRMRGFGFVEFSNSDVPVKASKEKYQDFQGKTIEVKPAEAKRINLKAAPGAGMHYGNSPGVGGYHDYSSYNQGYQHHHHHNYSQQYPHHSFSYGGNSSGGYGGQGGYGGYQTAQDYTYGRGNSYGQPSYGQSAPYGQNTPYGQSAPSYGQNPSYGQGAPPYGQGAPSYGQGGPSYGQSGPYGQGAPSYGQQDYSYGRNQQQQVPGYPPPPIPPPPHPPQDVGPQAPPPGAPPFNQQRPNYTSNSDSFGTGPPVGYGSGYTAPTAGTGTGYDYSGEQNPAAQTTNVGYGRGQRTW